MKTTLLFAMLASALLLASCVDETTAKSYGAVSADATVNVTDVIASPDGGATAVVNATNETTNSHSDEVLDGGADVIPISNDAVSTTPDSGAVQTIDTMPAPIIATDTLPTTVDEPLMTLGGDERLFDGTNGKFAWLRTDGALLAYDSSTRTVRELSAPTLDSTDPHPVLALAVNSDGNVAWIYQCYSTTQGGESVVEFVVMYESQQVDGVWLFRKDIIGNYNLSVAVSGNTIAYTLPTDGIGNVELNWFDLETKNTQIRSWEATQMYSPNGAHDIRLHGRKIGFMNHGQFVLVDLDNPANNMALAMPFAQQVDFNDYDLLVRCENGGVFWLYLRDKPGEHNKDVGQGTSIPTRTPRIVMNDSSVVAWSTNGGLLYQKLADPNSVPQFIPGASEFVLSGTNLYYIGPDARGNIHLYSRDIY